MAQSARPQELEDIVDAFMNRGLVELRVPGAVVSVVSDAEVLLCKGYGYADLERGIEAAENTVFRRLGLEAVYGHGDYAAGGKRARRSAGRRKHLANLLTHTTGFDECFIGMHARRTSDITSLAQYLSTNMPARRIPPGTIISYSDYGMSLLGLVVEEVSAMPFAEYVAQGILAPLGKHGSTFLQLVTPARPRGFPSCPERTSPPNRRTHVSRKDVSALPCPQP